MSETPKRHWFQFSLKTLLIIVALVAVYIAGHRNGFQKGYATKLDEYGLEVPFQSGGGRAYDVSDLVTQPSPSPAEFQTDAE